MQTTSKPTHLQLTTDHATVSNSKSSVGSPKTDIATRTRLIYSSLFTTKQSSTNINITNTPTRQPLRTTNDWENGRNTTSKYASQPSNTQSTTTLTTHTISVSSSGNSPTGK